MSRAFVKEPDGEEVFEELPDRPISPHPNLVTERGLALIEAEVARLLAERASAKAAGERGRLAKAARDLRYWTARRASAQLVPPPRDLTQVHFGARVTLFRGDGRRQRFRIVGEDEADPAQGSISHVSPLARALFGKEVGDTVRAGGTEVEILDVGWGTSQGVRRA